MCVCVYVCVRRIKDLVGSGGGGGIEAYWTDGWFACAPGGIVERNQGKRKERITIIRDSHGRWDPAAEYRRTPLVLWIRLDPSSVVRRSDVCMYANAYRGMKPSIFPFFALGSTFFGYILDVTKCVYQIRTLSAMSPAMTPNSVMTGRPSASTERRASGVRIGASHSKPILCVFGGVGVDVWCSVVGRLCGCNQATVTAKE